MSLFNPDYVDAHLLDQGFVPALGIAVPWTIFVLTLHTVWSISVPIALVEEWTPRRTTPWLRTPGFVIACVLLAVGCVSTTASTYGNEHYLAAWPKLLAVAVVVIALIAAAFALPGRTGVAVPGEAAPARPRRAAVAIAGEVAFARRRRAVFARPGRGGDVNPGGRLAPSPWLVLVVALVAGALFFLTDWWPVWWGVAAMIVALAGVGVAVGLWSRRAGWGRWHRLAAAAGGLLTYAWHGFTMNPLTGGGPVVTPVSHAIFALAVVALLWFELRSLRRRAPATELPAVSDRAGEHASTGDPARSE